MIADHPALPSLANATAPKNSAATGSWRTPIVVPRLIAMIRVVTAALGRWVKTPVLPYAALWEASLVAGALNDRERQQPDSYATEPHYLWKTRGDNSVDF